MAAKIAIQFGKYQGGRSNVLEVLGFTGICDNDEQAAEDLENFARDEADKLESGGAKAPDAQELLRRFKAWIINEYCDPYGRVVSVQLDEGEGEEHAQNVRTSAVGVLNIDVNSHELFRSF